MDTVIIDDGWHTDIQGGGYNVCGDWEVEPKKIPDMKNLVERIHKTGMNVKDGIKKQFSSITCSAYSFAKEMIDKEVNES